MSVLRDLHASDLERTLAASVVLVAVGHGVSVQMWAFKIAGEVADVG